MFLEFSHWCDKCAGEVRIALELIRVSSGLVQAECQMFYVKLACNLDPTRLLFISTLFCQARGVQVRYILAGRHRFKIPGRLPMAVDGADAASQTAQGDDEACYLSPRLLPVTPALSSADQDLVG